MGKAVLAGLVALALIAVVAIRSEEEERKVWK